MEKIPFFCLAALLLLAPERPLMADAAVPARDPGTPTMAYYSNGKVIYYGYTDYKRPYHPAYSAILATDPAFARAYYRDPTMAFYTKNGPVYYAYTKSPRFQRGNHLDWRYFTQPDQAVEVFRRESASGGRAPVGEIPQAVSRVKMRAPSVSNHEAIEQGAEQTREPSAETMAALQSTPVDAAGFYKRGDAYKETNDFEKAIQDYGEVIQLDPGNAYAYYKRGLCYSALDRMDLATEDFRRANELTAGQEKPWDQTSRSWHPQSGY